VKGSYRAKKGILQDQKIEKLKKLDFLTKNVYFASYGDSGSFGVTGWSGNIFCIEIDPVLSTFCLTE
jgi:hypothetical protein